MNALRVLLLSALLVACNAPGGTAPLPTPTLTPAGGPPSVTGTVTAGPVCPVEQVPPASACAPRPVGGAVIVATDAAGQVLGRATTAADGSYSMIVSATGTFVMTGLPVQGLMGVPAPVTITLAYPGASQRVDLRYDTGIR